MNINLYNYEEYFLLYADKELSGEERATVEDFVNQHPEFEEEFEMINNTILEPESFQLKDKSFLLKSTEKEFINKANYEEIFVLYHDGELSSEQITQADNFLNKNPELRDEFILLSQVKMQPDAVIFPGKKSLLRKVPSGITARIILFRSLAAAAVLGFGLWIAIPYFSETDSQHPIARQVVTPDYPMQEHSGSTKAADTNNSLAPNEQIRKNSEIQTEKTTSSPAVILEEVKETMNHKKEIMLANKENVISNIPDQKKNVLPSATDKKKVKTNEVMIAQIPPMEITAGEIINRNELAIVDVDITPDITKGNQTAQHVVYLDVDKASSGNYILHVPEEEFRKTKIGGFLKQLKRVVDRNDPIKRLFAGEEGQVASNN